jgi:hypothetical protein
VFNFNHVIENGKKLPALCPRVVDHTTHQELEVSDNSQNNIWRKSKNWIKMAVVIQGDLSVFSQMSDAYLGFSNDERLK